MSRNRFVTRVAVAVALSLTISSAMAAQSVASSQQLTTSRNAGLITLQLTGVTVEQALDTIAMRAGMALSWDRSKRSSFKKLSLKLKEVSVTDALAQATRGTGLVARITSDHQTIIVGPQESHGKVEAQGVITGKVTDAKTGKGVSGVGISVDGDARGVSTAEDGSYRLSGISVGNHTLSVRLVGYAKQTRTVLVAEGVTVTADFKLEPSANVLDQVVVTGSVVATELRAVPNAITVVTAKQIEERGITRIDQLFRGDVPGLFAQNQGSASLLEEVTMFSRGTTALSEASAGLTPIGGISYITNTIKTYVDGVELADAKYLSQIDPKSIERIEILTGPQASTIYGSNAINGVMQIFTKRGTSPRPQLALTLLSGWVQNNFSNARTPQHDYSAQLNGVEGNLSYNAGGSWNYMGPWTPAKKTARTGGAGGARLELPTGLGRVTADMTLRRSLTQNFQRGLAGQTETGYREMGWYSTSPFSPTGLSIPVTSTLAGQTTGLTFGYAPTSWWSNEFGLGQDVSDAETRYTARGYRFPSDTTLFLLQTHTARRSLRYVTTARIQAFSLAQATVTAGVDGWQNLASSIYAQPLVLTGTLSNVLNVVRQPGHNTGGFLQTQLGFNDKIFLTYGLRAEWNPAFGEAAQPNYAPRYGIAYTEDFGQVTAKLRGSYGRSTRPPQSSLKIAETASHRYGSSSSTVLLWGDYDYYRANAELGPEHQQGGEGGLELYLGTRGSLVVTRYNQTVDGLIALPQVDSLDLLPEWQAIYGSGRYYQYQYQYLNIGSIRNQGWELQGSANLGPVTTRGTYNWTKSRTIGITPKYRTQFANQPQYRPGASFQYLPEHTWAVAVLYARGATTLGLNVTGTGRMTNREDDFYFRNLSSGIRLFQNQLNVAPSFYTSFNKGYALADLTASHKLLPRVDGVLQIQNLTDRYRNDYWALYAVLGRQVKAGFRCR